MAARASLVRGGWLFISAKPTAETKSRAQAAIHAFFISFSFWLTIATKLFYSSTEQLDLSTRRRSVLPLLPADGREAGRRGPG